ncbi:MAG: hypothetical protein ACI814_000755 [Mariniblastus sp.]|jgi:hypothetical protein
MGVFFSCDSELVRPTQGGKTAGAALEISLKTTASEPQLGHPALTRSEFELQYNDVTQNRPRGEVGNP